MMEVEKSRPTPEEKAQRAAKQQNVGHRGPEKRVDPLPEPQAWLLAPMLNGDFDGQCLHQAFPRRHRQPCGRCFEEDPATTLGYGRATILQEVGGLPQPQEVLGHGKVSNSLSLVS